MLAPIVLGEDASMSAGPHVGSVFLRALPFVALALGGPRPLHDLPGHELIGIAVFAVALACLWWVGAAAIARDGPAARVLVLAGALLLAPSMLIALLWVGLGAPFQATALENQHRYIVLMVNALLAGAGFLVLRDVLRERGERFFSSALLAAAIPASGLYLVCVAITLAQATMALQGDRTPFPPILSHLYDALEFFACALTYVCTALAAAAMGRAGLLGRMAVRVFVVLCLVILVLLVLHGIEYPEISGRAAPWYTQPGVIVRIPAIPWLMPALMGAMLLKPLPATTEVRPAPQPGA
jgi:hypothetical protein